jgi:hypothetical protein
VAEGLSRCRKLGLEVHGAVSPWQLAEEQLRSTVLAYPCDPILPCEGFSMTCLEGLTAGCRLVISAADALPELWGSQAHALLELPVDRVRWAEAILDALAAGPRPPGPRQGLAPGWRAVAERWDAELRQLAGPRPQPPATKREWVQPPYSTGPLSR